VNAGTAGVPPSRAHHPSACPLSKPAVAGGELAALTLTDAGRALREGEVTAETYATSLLASHAANRHLNSIVSIDPALVLEKARAADVKRASGAKLGPLHGVPLAIKDSINTKALPTSVGTCALKEFRPLRDAVVADRLFGAGAILLGKTNLDELSFGWTSHNVAFGPTRNPYDPFRIPGGSSGGTACAIAARIAPAGLGADTVGSVRVPAALCGIVGFRPSPGRYPADGIAPIAPTLDTAGPMGRNVPDIILLDRIMSGRRVPRAGGSLKSVRLGLSPNQRADLDESVERTFAQALAKLRESGATIVEAELPEPPSPIERIIAAIRHHEAGPSLSAYLAAHDAPITLLSLIEAAGPAIKERLQSFVRAHAPAQEGAATYDDVMGKLRPTLQSALRDHFRHHQLDAMVFPTVRVTAPPVTEDVFSPGPQVELNGRKVLPQLAFGRNISMASAAGLPALALPAGLGPDGLPVGLELDGLMGEDDDLLRLGLGVESVLGSLPAPCP
jgi:mandelamide amidase